MFDFLKRNKKHREFMIGDIVTYDGEYGVVREVPIFNEKGVMISGALLVQWDTEKEGDYENCIGNLEYHLKKVENYPLRYIQRISIIKLIADLEEAEQLASEFRGGYSGDILSAEEFHARLKEAIKLLKTGNHSVLDELWYWFAPTCAWDDFIGQDGLELGNRIFEQLNFLRKQAKK